MKPFAFTASFAFLLLAGVAAYGQPLPAIIPQPVYAKQERGEYQLPAQPVIMVPAKQEAIARTAGLLASQLKSGLGRETRITTTGTKSDISFSLLAQPMDKLGKEGYMLQC
ncbi:MAG: hypothetical protein MUF29_03365, partial [Chitinophagaceae bacterium]|nr:hypothetical protein [Chitinophagaceae bacterium]